MREQIALRLLRDQDAEKLYHLEALESICLTDDNGGEPDGDAWIMWHTDGDPVTGEELASATAAGIACDLVRVWVADYPSTMWHPNEYMSGVDEYEDGWMGHQTAGQIALTSESMARAYQARLNGVEELEGAQR